jgi:hypothetical protein
MPRVKTREEVLRNRSGRRSERVLDVDAAVVPPVREVLGEHGRAAECARGFDNGGIPKPVPKRAIGCGGRGFSTSCSTTLSERAPMALRPLTKSRTSGTA